MDKKIVTLIIRISRLTDKMRSMSDDLEKISEWLQDPEILSLFAEKGLGVVTHEDYD